MLARDLEIIVVDDNEDLLDVVVLCFSIPGWRISTARSGSEALDHLARRTFDVMITDLNMPGMSGYQLIETISSDGSAGEMPIIVLTGYFTDEAARRLRTMGVAAIVAKPLDFETLKATVLSCARIGDGSSAP